MGEDTVGTKIKLDSEQVNSKLETLIKLLNKTNVTLTSVESNTGMKSLANSTEIASKSIKRLIDSSEKLKGINVSFDKIVPAVDSFAKKMDKLESLKAGIDIIQKSSQALNRFKMTAVELNKDDFNVDFSKITTGIDKFVQDILKVENISTVIPLISELSRSLNRIKSVVISLKDVKSVSFDNIAVGIESFINKVSKIKELEKYSKILDKLGNSLQRINKYASQNSIEKTTKKIEQLGDKSNKTTSLLSKINNKLKMPNLVAWVGMVKRAVSGITMFTDKSASYVENLNLMQVAFKENRQSAEDFVDGLADTVGLDESSMTRQLGFYKQIGNSLDIASEKSDMLSKNLLKMQLDMASLYNLSFDKSGEVIQSALAGQTKPIRGATGADITQASLQADLVNLGIDRQVKNLSRAEKVMLIYLSMQRQIQESNGDLSATVNTLANQQKILSEQTSRLSRALGNVLYPILETILPVLNGVLMVIVELVSAFAVFVGFKTPKFDAERYGDSVNGLDENVIDLTEDTDNLQKKMSGLRGFDKLNVISTPSSGSSKPNVGVGGVDPRILDAVKEYDLKLQDIDNNATKVRDKIMSWLGFTKEVDAETLKVTWKYEGLKNIKLDKFKNSLDELTNSLKKTLQLRFDEFVWFWESVLKPLGNFTISKLLPEFFDLLSNSLNILYEIYQVLNPLLQDFWDNFLIHIVGFIGDEFIIFLNDFNNGLKRISGWISENQKLVETIVIIIGSMGIAFGIVVTAMKLYNVIMGIASLVSTLFGTSLTIALSPMAIAVLAIGALIAIVVLLVKNWDKVKEVALNVWEYIKNVWKNVSKWFDDYVVKPLAYGFKILWWGISSGVITAVNFVILVFNNMVKGILAPLNLLISGLNLIPNVSIKKLEFRISYIDLPSIPKYEKGGFPAKENGLFFANDNEMIGKFSNGKTAVANNDQITTGIKQAVIEAFTIILPKMQQQDGNTYVYIGDEEVDNIITKKVNKHDRQYGY
ncbi:MAG: hypothetical protein RR478_00830 [Bacilli bacterium]